MTPEIVEGTRRKGLGEVNRAKQVHSNLQDIKPDISHQKTTLQ